MDELEAVELGEKAREFVESDLGMALLQLAEKDAFDALEKLADISPVDSAGIGEIQRQVKHYHTFKAYLAELVSRGDEALRVYQQQRDINES